MKVIDLIESYKASGKRGLAVLLDPDKLQDTQRRASVLELINSSQVDLVFMGGSLIVEDEYEQIAKHIFSNCSKPVVLFPGSATQVTEHVDAMLFLSLISGRNADLLIGQHIVAAPRIKKLGIEAISTGYMLVDCGQPTTASYISNTLPIPHDKPEIAAVTAMAGELQGKKLIYLDGGSGAQKCVSKEMIAKTQKSIDIPLIVGGGIRSHEDAQNAWTAGADFIVIGTAIEENPDLLFDICAAKTAI